MVREKDEDIIILCGLKNPSTSFTSNRSFVSLQNFQKYFRIDIGSFVVNHNSLVDINTWISSWRFVEYFSFDGVFDVVGDVIIGKGNDSVLSETILFEDLIGVKDISLMAIVGIGVGASN